MTQYFDQAATGWDDDPKRVRMAEGVAEAMIRYLRLHRRQVLLDYGTGTGLVALRLYPCVQKIIAADSSAGMLAVLKQKIKQQRVTNIRPLEWSLDMDPKALPKLDVIVSSMTLHHIPDIAKVAGAFFRLLAPGGQLGVADLDEEHGDFHASPGAAAHNGFKRAEFKDLFAEAGFTGLQFHEAHTTIRTLPTGKEKPFTLFLLTGAKK
jgi:ubiquinone/menaquinone biosynthesis C-methylase UbiE